MRRHTSFLLIILLSTALLPAFGQDNGDKNQPKSILEKGIELFGEERYREALDAFGKVLSDARAGDARPEAAYWSVLAYIASGDNDTAFASIDAFVAAYPTSPRLSDMLYQRGRLYYAKADYESALKAFAAFAEASPKSDLMPSALYWCGECLYSLGRLEEAERAFAVVVEKYPSSVKVEAASYRRSLIGLEYRERELLKLLTWSHEESLRAVEDFRRREKAYEQSIAIYQKQLADSKRGAASDEEKILADLRAQTADLGAQVAALQAELATSKSEAAALRTALEAERAAQAAEALLAPAPAPAPKPVPILPEDVKSEALAAKSRALDLLAFYLERIAKEGTK
jgi:outer membrane protein assembly factor BamD (BamD/ComL family)